MNTQTPSRLALVTLGAAAILAYAPLAQAKVPFDPTMISDVAEQVTPAVVNITTRKNGNVPEGHPMLREMFGRGMPMMGAGSGVVVSADGDIVTNNHVVEGADEIKVTFADKREFDAKLVGSDKASDLAFLKIEAKGLPYLRFGDSSKLRLGEFVLAVGNPFGVGQTVTMGIVSAKGRAGMGIVDYEEFIQTDASINPGNSGGALVNLEGELVGINTAILSRSGGNQGVGFAVPSNMVRPIREQLAKYGRVRRGYLGVYIQDLTPELASGVKANDLKGVLVTDVQEDSPAAKANVEVGDVITQVDGNPTLTAAQLRNRVALIEPGSKVKLDVMREGQAKTVYVTLTEKEGGQVALQSGEGAAPLGAGLGLAKLDAELRGRLRLPPRVDGVVVMNVAPGSPADLAGLEPGDVIVSVDRRTVKKPGDVEKLLKRDGGQALLRVYKNGAFTFVVLKGK
ncbi:MAG: DegQ family serine endoprotease [Myxococcales bacterium]|nr:DegQ family serine endoprotease [Myxococcales bacterium]